MKYDVAEQPPRLRMVLWDGGNVDEVNQYIADVNDPEGTAEVVVNEDGTAFVRSPMGNKPLVPGALVHAVPWMWGGPVITTYTPEEAQATLYLYPTYPPVVEPPNSDV